MRLFIFFFTISCIILSSCSQNKYWVVTGKQGDADSAAFLIYSVLNKNTPAAEIHVNGITDNSVIIGDFISQSLKSFGKYPAGPVKRDNTDLEIDADNYYLLFYQVGNIALT